MFRMGGGDAKARAPAYLLATALAGGSYTSPAALLDQANLCSGRSQYPANWVWDPAKTANQPRAATPEDGLQPRIEQVRNGKVIAVWQSLGSGTCKGGTGMGTHRDPKPAAEQGCGPFGRSHNFQTWENGDTFLVYPAVYDADHDANQPWIGPNFQSAEQYSSGKPNVPTDITIKGVTVNGIRPVFVVGPSGVASSATLGKGIFYLDKSRNLTIENIDIAGDHPRGGYAAIYVNGVSGTTIFRQMRIHGFASANMGGIFGTIKQNTGTIVIDQVELYENGGVQSGAMHNVYINDSLDPKFTIHMIHSWSYDASYGHTFKSRSPINILEGNYFGGSVPRDGFPQAESYLVDIPFGGQLTMKNNILVKNQSGPNSNAMSLTYLMEGIHDDRTQSVDVENNTFVALSRTNDGTHPLYPTTFGYPAQLPNANGLLIPAGKSYEQPFAAHQIGPQDFIFRRNLFVGYCPSTFPTANYRGDEAATAGFSDLNHDFSLKEKVQSRDRSIIGTPAYSHAAQPGRRRAAPTIGAVD